MRPVLAVLLALLPVAPAIGDPNPAPEFPRRLLVVRVGNTFYLNPLATDPGPADRLAAALSVPAGRVAVLADSPGEGAAPTKAAITAAVRSFCATSRRQDRVLLDFTGHAVERDGKAFFVPVEGDPADPATLVPVAEVFEALKACKATQRVVVWDVCRRNPDVHPVRPASGPMTETLAKSLTDAPEGVQVLLPCSPGEYSLEPTSPAGGGFRRALTGALADRAAEIEPRPDDPIPLAEVFPAVGKRLAADAKTHGLRQTPRLTGKPPAGLVPFDPKEAAPAAVEVPVPKSASAANVGSVLDELALPPLSYSPRPDPLPPFPFAPDAMKPYAPDVTTDEVFKDVEKYRLRAATLGALQTIRDGWPGSDPNAAPPITEVPAGLTDRVKKAARDAQEPLAVAVARLELTLEELDAVADLRGKEPRRWQAHYDFAAAQTRLRLAYLNEYNRALGHVRTENLPPLPAGSAGWRLVPADGLRNPQPGNAKLAARAVEGFKALAADTRGTPWEVLARRALLVPRGVRWEPVR